MCELASSLIVGSVKLMLDRQEKAFTHLTPLAVWIQNRAPVCTTEEKMAEQLRDSVRREAAGVWVANIGI